MGQRVFKEELGAAKETLLEAQGSLRSMNTMKGILPGGTWATSPLTPVRLGVAVLLRYMDFRSVMDESSLLHLVSLSASSACEVSI